MPNDEIVKREVLPSYSHFTYFTTSVVTKCYFDKTIETLKLFTKLIEGTIDERSPEEYWINTNIPTASLPLSFNFAPPSSPKDFNLTLKLKLS